jgi:hypothetical protein
MRIVFGCLAALFVFAASLQYNDPDPARWMAIYLAAALTCGLAAARHPAGMRLSFIVGPIALFWALTYIPAVLRHRQVLSMFDEWTMRNEEVLQSREMFGLILVTLAMLMVLVWSGRDRRMRLT